MFVSPLRLSCNPKSDVGSQEEYKECDLYAPFVAAGKPAFDIEYKAAPKCKTGWFSMQYGASLALDFENIVATCPKFAGAA